MEPANEVSRERSEARKGREGGRRETGKIEKWVMGVREEGWRSGVSIFYHLPGRPPGLTLTDFDFRLVKKGKGLRPSVFRLLFTQAAPVPEKGPIVTTFAHILEESHLFTRTCHILEIDCISTNFQPRPDISIVLFQ